MTVPVDLDRAIMAWLQEGERGAPERLAGAVLAAVERTPQSRGLQFAWPRPSAAILRVMGGAIAAVLVVALAIVAFRGPLGLAATPTPSVGPTNAVTTSPTGRPSASPRPTRTAAPATPEPTYPAERTFSIYGIELDLAPGWYDPPDSYWLAIAAVLDQIHDPDAGVLNMILHADSRAPSGQFAFHRPDAGGSFDTGLRVREAGTAGQSARQVADDTAAALREVSRDPLRTRIDLSGRQVPVVEWDETYNETFNMPQVHYVSAFLGFNGTVIRVDFATVGSPTRDQRQTMAEILQSARVAGR